MSADYDKDLINRAVVAVCDYYLTNRRGEGKRQTYPCPVCGDRHFEVDPERGYAGCFDAACEAPTTTDALGIIAYFEERDLSGKGFVETLQKGYEILGIADPREQSSNADSDNRQQDGAGGRKRAMTPRKKKAMTPRRERGGEDGDLQGSAGCDSPGQQPEAGTRWAAATGEAAPKQAATLEQPIQAWQEHADGSRSAIAAVVIQEPETEPEEEQESGQDLEAADLGSDAGDAAGEGRSDSYSQPADERNQAHEVYEAFLKLCPREERDEAFLEGRGLDAGTIEEGRFGSISKERCGYVLGKLRQKFSEEDLTGVPGFYRPEGAGVRCSVYGDYALIPYFDQDGYIRTVEGRFTGDEMGEYDKKYKALLNSGVHLYVHPRFKPDEIVAICEGAIGAMVAARYGFAVASIKGFRNYRMRSDNDDGSVHSVLPEFEGVDLAGKEVVFIPDRDVKPDSYEAVMKTVPDACHWLIERQGGVAKVAMLPEGAKDLDAWLLSLEEGKRVGRFYELLRGAHSLTEWKEEYLRSGCDHRTEEQRVGHEPQQEQTGIEEVGDEDYDGAATEESTTGEATIGEGGQATEPVSGGTREQDQGEQESGTPESQEGGHNPAKGSTDFETGSDGEDGQAQRQRYEQTDGKTHESPSNDQALSNDQTTRIDQPELQESTSTGQEHLANDVTAANEPGRSPATGPTPLAAARGEYTLVGFVYVLAAILATVCVQFVAGDWLIWPQSAGLGAGIAIWLTSGFIKLRRWHTRRRLARHIEGTDV